MNIDSVQSNIVFPKKFKSTDAFILSMFLSKKLYTFFYSDDRRPTRIAFTQ